MGSNTKTGRPMVHALEAYWSTTSIDGSLIVILHMLGALGLGILMGYERVYHGRAAGMRTYALVCMAATALTVTTGFPDLRLQGSATALADPGASRVIQGIVTGIGFLGAGVILRDGLSLRGLSTAASIWMASAIGVLNGLGYFAAAIAAAFATATIMSLFSRIEAMLPHYALTKLSLTLEDADGNDRARAEALVARHGHAVADWTLTRQAGVATIDLLLKTDRAGAVDALIEDLTGRAEVRRFSVTPVRD